ncbi:transcriptional regulator FtsR [Catellatospora vulcania]|uniref:transcriptional regulator FtsR n=1 Tax=Catellatospora vulcania TaxID=1460450 RepID=UPI001E453245|nr:MerR family transcriptional regulator [Catellatospora vulcania]
MTGAVPASAGGGGGAARAQTLMSIGEVLGLLRPDFPDVTISKLRFLETEGLVEPQRTSSGYRKYSREDVARLRFILAAQRDQYLPLRVIREQLSEGAHLTQARPTLVAVGDDHRPEAVAEPVDERLRRQELCHRAGITEALLADLERHGLVTARAGEWFDGDALAVAEVAGQLAEYGVEPRHLRAYRVAADREAGLYAQLVAPLMRQQDPTARARAAEAMRELTVLSQRLHVALLRSGLNDALGG